MYDTCQNSKYKYLFPKFIRTWGGDSSQDVNESVMFSMMKQESQYVEDVILFTGLENSYQEIM